MSRERIQLVEGYPVPPNGNGHEIPKTFPTREVVGERNLAICMFCLNSLREICLESCAPSKRYGSLSPKPLEQIPFLPTLPTFQESASWSAAEKWAITYLVMFYLLQKEKHDRFSY